MDRTAAISWIKSDARLYKPLVAHRVRDIREITDVGELRCAPSR